MLPDLPKVLKLNTVQTTHFDGASTHAEAYLDVVNSRLAIHHEFRKGDPQLLYARQRNADGLVRNLDHLLRAAQLTQQGPDVAKDRKEVEKLRYHAQQHSAFYGKLRKYLLSKNIKEQTIANAFDDKIPGTSKDFFFKDDQLYTTVTKGYGAEKLDPHHRQKIGDAYRAWLTATYGTGAKVGVESFVEFCLLSADYPKKTAIHFATTSRVPDFDLYAEHYVLTFADGHAYTEYLEESKNQCTELTKLTEKLLYQKYLATTWLFHTRHLEFQENLKTCRVPQAEHGASDRLPWSFLYVMRKQKMYAYPVIGVTMQKARHPSGVGHKAIQAAGHIVAEKGKIVAIDNNTGHYSVEWVSLRQAVEMLVASEAFDEGAVVGVYYPSSLKSRKTLFFPLAEFLYMARNHRLRDADWIKSFLVRVKAGGYKKSAYYTSYLKSDEIDPTDENADAFAKDMRAQSKTVVEGLGKDSIFKKAV